MSKPRRMRFYPLKSFVFVCGVASIFLSVSVLLNGTSMTSKARKSSTSTSLASQTTCHRPNLPLWPNNNYRNWFLPPGLQVCHAKVWSDGKDKFQESDWTRIQIEGVDSAGERKRRAIFNIDAGAEKKHGNITCQATSLFRQTDFEMVRLRETSLSNNTEIDSSLFEVSCKAADNTRYVNVHTTILRNETLVQRCRQKLEQSRGSSRTAAAADELPNILMIGFDSVSRLTWMRHLPQTYRYLTEQLSAVVLEGYNIVGDGTPAALLPILTGLTESELPEARRGYTGARTVDNFPWIWSSLQSAGYITQFAEDMPGINTFTYRLLGFSQAPTDHYMRPFYLSTLRQFSKFCFGAKKSHQVMFQLVREFFEVYHDLPKFSFAFHGAYSHDYSNRLVWADNDLKDFLFRLNNDGLLDNTMLVLMSDHGARFANFRNTEQGKFEERLPFMAIRPPPWFSNRYPEAVSNLRKNAKRLTTPFDINKTLLQLVNRSDYSEADVVRGTRGISLFNDVPHNRSCEDAAIEAHWCTCLNWRRVDVRSKEVLEAADALLSTINSLIAEHVAVCAQLSLHHVISAFRYTTNPELLKFKESRGEDLKPDMTDNMKPTSISVVVNPSGAIYQATVKHDLSRTASGATYTANAGEISRLNRYGDQPSCVASRLPHLRPYCYCKKS